MISNEQRQVQRSVKVYRCDRCRAEALEEAITGWTILVVVEIRPAPTVMGTIVDTLTAKQGADQHACPSCTLLVRRLMGEQPAPMMVGNDIANIAIRMQNGEALMLTRFEWESWVANGKPPILSAADVKVKS